MRNGYIRDTLASFDVQENVKNGGKVIEVYEGDTNREIFRKSQSKQVMEKRFASRENYKDKGKDLLQV